MDKIRLKGGSLSGTYLCTLPDGKKFIRKEVSLVENREYGFQRWYSQLKRLQRYQTLVSGTGYGLFPKLLDCGRFGHTAYFDLEYIKDSVTLHEFICQSKPAAISDIVRNLLRTANSLHNIELDPQTRFDNLIDLYFVEEVEHKLSDCMHHPQFRKFASNKTIGVNGRFCPSLVYRLDVFREMFEKTFIPQCETYSHGNLTLENILIVPNSGRIVFIDPYEENVFDSYLADYSQILQSSDCKYELYNAAPVIFTDNSVETQEKVKKYPSLDIFNRKVRDYFLSSRHRQLIELLKISQFVRMLPFKMNFDVDKMILFYGLASLWFDEYLEEYGN